MPLLPLVACLMLAPWTGLSPVPRTGLSPGGAPAGVETPAVAASPKNAAKKLGVYMKRLKKFRKPDEAEVLSEVRGLLDDVLLQRFEESGSVAACDVAALDVAAHGWLPQPERLALIATLNDPRSGMHGETPINPTLAQRVSLLGIGHLERLLDQRGGDAVARFLASEVLARTREHGLERRRAACDLLIGRHIASTQSALFASARDDDDLLREAAFRALAGWDDAEVHGFVLRELERGRVSLPIAIAHLEAAQGKLGEESLDHLGRQLTALLASTDWRDAVRGVRLAEVMDGMLAAPLLIEALVTWDRRRAEGGGSLRVTDEIVTALRKLSGRAIPPQPDRWRLWWKAVQDGRVELPPEGDDPGAVTSADFFGLRPVTDRVIFVIDRSRSMTAGFGTTGRSRYEEAVEELLGFATKLGEEAHFGVTLFHSGAQRWRPRLTAADEPGIKAARRWLDGEYPDGGTQLFSGLREALDLGRDGSVDPAKLQADTVIILCDGDTAEGPHWVLPWLERANEDAQLVFHCVQVGGRGDGTLERLAEGTGGDFVRIEG